MNCISSDATQFVLKIKCLMSAIIFKRKCLSAIRSLSTDLLFAFLRITTDNKDNFSDMRTVFKLTF
jgi:hypothetical protein